MVTDKDDRIQLPPTLVDFDNVVGITGQLHDNFPAGGQQPRYDWMRSFLIGLLACQSSNDPPTQYRIGTPWYNRIKKGYFTWNGTAWVSLSEVIIVSEDSSGTISLATSLALIQQKLLSIQPRLTFSGYCTNPNVVTIPIPSTAQSAIVDIGNLLRPLVYINGHLIDPRLCAFNTSCPSLIILSGTAKLQVGDKFTVIIERFDVFISEDVIAI